MRQNQRKVTGFSSAFINGEKWEQLRFLQVLPSYAATERNYRRPNHLSLYFPLFAVPGNQFGLLLDYFFSVSSTICLWGAAISRWSIDPPLQELKVVALSQRDVNPFIFMAQKKRGEAYSDCETMKGNKGGKPVAENEYNNNFPLYSVFLYIWRMLENSEEKRVFL